MKKVIVFFLIIIVAFGVSLVVSEWIYSLSFGSVNRIVNFFISLSVVLSSVVSVVLIFKSFRDFLNGKLGSKIRLRLIGLFLLSSLISSIILSSIFISIVDALKVVNETKDGERVSEISKNILDNLSEYYKEVFENLDKSVYGRYYSRDVRVVEIDNLYTEDVRDKVLRNILEYIKLSGSDRGKSLVIVDDKEFAFVFVKNEKIKIAYSKIDDRILGIKIGASKILKISSNSEFLFYEIFGKYVVVILILLNIPSFFVSILIAYLFSDYITKGISKLSEGMAEVSKGNLNFSISDKGALDEIKDLIKEFNRMTLKLLDAQYRTSKLEKMELWKDIARKVAHEIKNPLTPIKLSIQRILLNPDVENFKERVLSSLLIINDEIDRIDNLVSQFSSFAKIPMPFPSLFRFSNVVEVIREFFSHQGVEIEYIHPEDDVIYADEDQIKQCLINLVKNGVEASDGISNKITITLKKDDEKVVVSVRDYGIGIPEDLKDKILKPYTTTKKSGSGLGLSIVETIVLNHGGKLYFESEVGKGSEFFIELPNVKP